MQQYQKICNSLTWKSGMHKHYLRWKFIFQQQLFSYNASKEGPRTHCTHKMVLQDVTSHYSAWCTFDGKMRLLLECSYHDTRTSSRYGYWPVDDSPTLPTCQYACAAVTKEWARTILHKVTARSQGSENLLNKLNKPSYPDRQFLHFLHDGE